MKVCTVQCSLDSNILQNYFEVKQFCSNMRDMTNFSFWGGDYPFKYDWLTLPALFTAKRANSEKLEPVSTTSGMSPDDMPEASVLSRAIMAHSSAQSQMQTTVSCRCSFSLLSYGNWLSELFADNSH